jgi:UTP--glucose-1-phosphate uridylyltransferase
MTPRPTTTHSPIIPSTRSSVAAKAMRNELNRMANNVQDPEAKKIFSAEMEDFFILFNRYLTEKAKNETM